MKKTTLLIIFIALFFVPKISYSQRDRILSNGFNMNGIVGFLPNDYSLLEGDENFKSSSNLFGFEFGNRWTTKFGENFAFGAKINWLEVSFYKRISTYENTSNYEELGVNMKFIETGPVFTYALNKKTGIDMYYQISPGIVGDWVLYYTHAVGVGFRRNIFMLNFEYIFGDTYSGKYIDYKHIKVITDNARILVGFKF